MPVYKILLSCLTLYDPKDCSPPGSSVPEILQARTLERVAILFSRGSSRPRDRTWVFYIVGRFLSVYISVPGGASGKEAACQGRRLKRRGFDPRSGRAPGEENGNPLQYCCLENPTDRGARRAPVHGVTESRTRLKQLSTHSVYMYQSQSKQQEGG